IDGIDDNIFIADDALGWVYQFWQSEAKAAINASGDKIDGAKLPAVTQLFTEPYMVHFLIDNTLGAWWVSRNPQENSPVKFEYLRVAPTKVAPTKVAPTSSRSDSKNLRQDDGVTVTTSSNQSNTSEWWNYFNPFEEVEHIKGNLPHWRQEHKLYFVTFRTADSMPQEKLKAWQEERDAWKRHNPEPLSPEQKKEYYSRFPAKVQAYLDAGYGECLLAKPEIKRMMEEAIRHFDGQRYKLDEFVVAANHVHVLVEPLGENQLSEILHSWKSFTANEINKATGRQGTFWQKESFDHLVRSEASLEKFREYIRGHVSKVAPNSSRSNSESLRQDDGVTVAQASSRSNSESLRQDDGVTVAQASSRSDIDYLRQDGGATFGAAFEGWPEKTAEVTAMDPCMGSGHFLAALFPVFAKLRMHEEGLSKEEVADKVIAENLHGLELDPRCTQIAAFNLALAAWKFCGHYKALPEMNLACSGIAPKGKVEDWIKLVAKEKDPNTRYRMENGMRQLFNHFQLAPELGSLLDPTTIKADLETASFKELQPVLKKALEIEEDTDEVERGVIAAGIAKAGQLLSKKYTLQITNVPYLSRGKQDTAMADFIEKNYSEAKGDLATVFLQKMLKTNTTSGISCSVIPQNWLFLTSYKKFRERLLKNETWNVVTRLGTKGFQTPMWDFNVMLIAISHAKPSADHTFAGLDVSDAANAAEKDEKIKTAELKIVNQKEQLGNPDMVVSFESLEQESL
ncbi:MAG: transposase, partial [Chitinophagaceae bacterium]|nr:transposase [Chitinophagaceae bacterium]